jgi:alginate O-acetyltransferase complex protein AlgI
LAACVPVVLLPLTVFVCRDRMAPWAVMSVMALAIFGGCKWLTLADEWHRGGQVRVRRALAYLLAWPGMNAREFLRDGSVPRPMRAEWSTALRHSLIGIAVMVGTIPTLKTGHSLLAGWMAMLGLILVLHFGTFHLLSVAWRRAGVSARPLMNQPTRAGSLADFWGRRWNVAFHQLASRYLFNPVRPRVGAARASLLVFLVSGLVHELAISVPAGGGYGLPTMYFVVQGAGLACERSHTGRRLGLGRGRLGWIFTALVTAVPAFWLFPPVFVHRVIVPMIAVLGAH